MNLDKIEQGVTCMLEGIGIDLKNQHFIDTPKRVAKAYNEIFYGLEATDEKVKKILSTSFKSSLSQMIVQRDILVFSMCPHHFLPVKYMIDVGYIPNGRILGLSKLSRIVELLARRPVVQEELASDITGALSKIKPRGAAVKIRGEHFCMSMRGIRKPGAETVVSNLTGAFQKPATRNEFFQLVK